MYTCTCAYGVIVCPYCMCKKCLFLCQHPLSDTLEAREALLFFVSSQIPQLQLASKYVQFIESCKSRNECNAPFRLAFVD